MFAGAADARARLDTGHHEQRKRTPSPPHDLASVERGSVSRSNLGSGSALRLTEPRSVRVAGFKGATREVLFRGILPRKEERRWRSGSGRGTANRKLSGICGERLPGEADALLQPDLRLIKASR